MPIIKYKDVTLHFAHIPKCGGSSVEEYVKGLNGAELAFVDISYVLGNTAKKPWNISSPQHIDGDSFSRLFPKAFFSAFFAVVRNPLNRVKSAYQFQRFVHRTIKHTVTLDDFVKNELKANYLKLGWMDNHFLPQHRFLYPRTAYQIYKLEAGGVDKAKHYIDRMLFGNSIEQVMPHENPAKKWKGFNEADLDLSEESRKIINDIYKADFERFKYPFSD